MDWEIGVTGSEAVLGHLAEVLKDSEVRLVRVGDAFVLRAPEFESLADAESVRARGNEIVEALSAVARLELQSGEPLKVGRVARAKAGDRRDYFLHVEPGRLRITGGLTSIIVKRADGTVEEHRPADAVPAWLSKVLLDRNKLRALRLRDSNSLAWPDLYRLFEVIEAGLGGEASLLARGWVTRDTIRRFRHSANSVAVAGDQARHGVEYTEPPARPMTISEARGFLDMLLRNWLGECAA
jgi:hypothetical protein